MFTKQIGKKITLTSAANMTADWRSANPTSTKAVFIGSDHISDIINQLGCVGMRIYFAKDSAGKDTVVLVGAKADETDMETGYIVNSGEHCPFSCANGSLDT
jgi:hypothetical protein